MRAPQVESRAALVQAAFELFAEQGLDVPSLDAICDRAGYTRGAFYVHFKTREDTIVAVMDQVGAVFFASMFQGLSRRRRGRRYLSPQRSFRRPTDDEAKGSEDRSSPDLFWPSGPCSSSLAPR